MSLSTATTTETLEARLRRPRFPGRWRRSDFVDFSLGTPVPHLRRGASGVEKDTSPERQNVWSATLTSRDDNVKRKKLEKRPLFYLFFVRQIVLTPEFAVLDFIIIDEQMINKSHRRVPHQIK